MMKTIKDQLESTFKTLSGDKKNNVFLLFLILLFCLMILTPFKSKFKILSENFIYILLFQLFLIVPGFYSLKILNKRYFTNNIAILLSYPASIIAFGLIWIILQIFSSPPIVYPIINGCFVIAVLSLAYKKNLSGNIFKIGEIYKYGLLLVLIGAIVAASFVSVDTKNPKHEIVHCSLIPKLHPMPHDNELQYKTAKVFIKNSAPWASRYWTMGDRPPLMGIINSIWAFSTLNTDKYEFWYYEMIGIVLNILFIFPCVIISKKLFKDQNIFYLVPLAILLNVFIFLNIYYTWPKLMGAFFPLASIALLLIKKRIEYFTMSIVGILWGLGYLCHPGVILTLPVLFVFYLISSINFKKIKYFIPFFIFFFLLQSPWIIYKKFHPRIDTNHLLYHYLPTESYRGHPLKTIIHFFKEFPLEKQLKHRFNMLKAFIQNENIYIGLPDIFTGHIGDYYKKLFNREFRIPIIAMGELQILLSIGILFFCLVKSFLFKQGMTPTHLNKRLILFFLSFVILSYAFNAFFKWTFSYNHELPYVELILGIIIVSGFSFSFNRTIRILSFSLIAFRFGYYVIQISITNGYQIFDFFNVIVFLGIIAEIYLSHYYRKRFDKFKLQKYYCINQFKIASR